MDQEEAVDACKMDDKEVVDACKMDDKEVVDVCKMDDKEVVDACKIDEKEVIDACKMDDKESVGPCRMNHEVVINSCRMNHEVVINSCKMEQKEVNFTEACNQEYCAQYFGWTPKSFIDGTYNAVLEYTWEMFSAAQQFIKSQFPECVTEEQLQKSATETFFPKICKAIDKAFDKFEIYVLTNIFVIPAQMVLPEDVIQESSVYSERDEQLIDTEITDLKQQIINCRYMNERMRVEIEQIDKVQKLYKEFAHFQSQLDTLCQQSGVSELHEALVYSNNRAQKINAILSRMQHAQESGESSPPHPIQLA